MLLAAECLPAVTNSPLVFNYGCSPKVGRMAGLPGPRRIDLQGDQGLSARRAFRPHRSIATCRRLGSIQHRGGLRSAGQQGAEALSRNVIGSLAEIDTQLVVAKEAG